MIEEAVVTASSTRRGRVRLVAGSALVAALLALSACGAGQQAQTAQQQSAISGVNGEAGDGRVALRNALIPFAGSQGFQQGGNAPMAVSIFNNGLNTVKLVDVSAQDASDVVLVGGAATNLAPSPSAPPPSPTGSASPSATGSPSAAPSPTNTAPSGQTSFSITIGSGGYAVLTQQDGTYLQLVGLKKSLAPGDTVQVVFTFDDGSSATMTLPVGPATAAVPRNPPVVTTSPGE
jgi:copper(I)-binding protein